MYNELLEEPEGDPVNNIYAACAMYALGMYKEASEYAKKGACVSFVCVRDHILKYAC